MLEWSGDIWEKHREGQWVVITTNIGWKKDGTNPMGAGIARTAAELFPELPAWYGAKCRKYREDTAVTVYKPGLFFLFPTKELADQPWMSWNADSSLDLIIRSTKQLVMLVDELNKRNEYFIPKVIIPMVGCQNGNLDERDVYPILKSHLDDRFILCLRK